MLPVIAIVGRPNVGKSTLFNCLTRTRRALVADEPGVTRDRLHGLVELDDTRFIVIDTGGLTDASDTMSVLISDQAMRAVEDSDAIVFLTDAKAGLTPADETIAERLRATGLPLILVANKSEGVNEHSALAEFHRLGLETTVAISAAHRRGTTALVETLGRITQSPPDSLNGDLENSHSSPSPESLAGTRIAILGRPNVGKSTLVNRLSGQDRVIAHDMPGTTRDSIFVPFHHRDRPYVLIDTAGIRRRARVREKVEKFSVIKAIQAMEQADVVVLVLDATQGVTEQDLGLLGHIIDSGRALCIAINKWDAVTSEERRAVKTTLERRLAFIDYVQPLFISATRGRGLGALMQTAQSAWESACRKFPTPELTRILQEAVAHHPPPVVRGRRIKLRYAHQGGSSPPVVVVHGNQTDAVPANYVRYLARCFRDTFRLVGTPLELQFKTGDNPYEGRRNKLTPRQERKRRRMMKHVKKG